MRFRNGLVLVALTVACAKTPSPAVAPATCPTIAPPGMPYPTVSYHTLVLDGKVLYARRGQRNMSAHWSVPIDSAPSDRQLDRVRIKDLRFLTGDSARFYEPCPGVRVVAIDSERHWWWPW